MDSIRLLKGYASKLEASQKELQKLETRAKKLAEKDAEMNAERISLEQQIDDRERAVEGFHDQRTGLLEEWSLADFNNDTQRKRDIQQQRAEIDRQVEDHEQELVTLRSSLDDLEDLDRDGAELAVELDRLELTGDWFSFLDEMRKALRSNAANLSSRRNEARKNLPPKGSSTYEEIRLAEDDDYRSSKEHREAEGRRLQARLDRNKRELDIAAGTQYVGTGERGSRRASTIGEATQKIRESRR